jgi:hypothetical protein
VLSSVLIGESQAPFPEAAAFRPRWALISSVTPKMHLRPRPTFGISGGRRLAPRGSNSTTLSSFEKCGMAALS